MLRTSGTKLLAAALTVVLAGVCLADGYLIHGRRPAAAPPAGVEIYDDFNTNSIANWTGYGNNWSGNITIDGGDSNTMVAGGGSDSGTAIYATPLTADAGYACVSIVGTTTFTGFKFRSASDDSGRSYAIRVVDDANQVVWRYCLIDDCTSIETDAAGVGVGLTNHFGVRWSGTGCSTSVSWYLFSGGCDCAAGVCDTSGWAAAAVASSTFTTNVGPSGCSGSGLTTTYSALDSNLYFGLYNGDGQAQTFDDFYAGDD